jgi:hypothetical protein
MTCDTRSPCRPCCAGIKPAVDVERTMPLLSTYLGHIDPNSTFWYLHATPELMRPVAGKLEGIQGGRS